MLSGSKTDYTNFTGYYYAKRSILSKSANELLDKGIRKMAGNQAFSCPPPRNFKNLTLYSSDDNLLGVVEYTKNKQGIKKVLQVNDDGKNIVYYRREYNRCFRKVCEKSDKILQEMETFIKNTISKFINQE